MAEHLPSLRLDVSAPDVLELMRRARALLDAMDRQYGSAPFSVNVRTARNALRELLPVERVESDRADFNH